MLPVVPAKYKPQSYEFQSLIELGFGKNSENLDVNIIYISETLIYINLDVGVI